MGVLEPETDTKNGVFASSSPRFRSQAIVTYSVTHSCQTKTLEATHGTRLGYDLDLQLPNQTNGEIGPVCRSKSQNMIRLAVRSMVIALVNPT